MIREFSGLDCVVSMFGRTVAADKISYKVKQDKKNHYVMGSAKPYSKLRKTKEYEGSVTFPQSEFEAIQRNLPAGKDITDIAQFDVVVMFIDSDTGVAITDILKDCEFTEAGKEMGNDSEMMQITCPLSIGNIQFNFK